MSAPNLFSELRSDDAAGLSPPDAGSLVTSGFSALDAELFSLFFVLFTVWAVGRIRQPSRFVAATSLRKPL